MSSVSALMYGQLKEEIERENNNGDREVCESECSSAEESE